MKINWGTSIVIAFVLFIGFILFFVIKSHQKQNKHDLVSDEYYKEELKYQDEIDKLQNAKNLSEEVSISKTNNGLEIDFPYQFNNDNIAGLISLTRPSNALLDFQEQIVLNNQKVIISKEKLVEGNWSIRIEFTSEETAYLIKESIIY